MKLVPTLSASARSSLLSVLMTATTPPPPQAIAAVVDSGAAALVRSPAGSPTDSAYDAAAALMLADRSRVIKSMVLVAQTGVPLLVLAPGTSRIDIKALESVMNCRIRFASAAEAEAATGHTVGCIPPVCAPPLASDNLRVFMDRSVLTRESPVYAGGGQPGLHLRMDPQALQLAAGATVGDFVVGAATAPPPPPPAPPTPQQQRWDDQLSAEGAGGPPGVDQRPGGPDVRPLRDEVAAVIAARSLTDGFIELRSCEVLRVRRQARQLLFASLRVLEPPRRHNANGPPRRGAARNTTVTPLPAALSVDASWQLIVGKSLSLALGEEEAHARMGRIKPGCVVAVRGRVQPNPRETGPDIVAHSLEILAPPPERGMPKGVAEAEDAPSDSLPAPPADASPPPPPSLPHTPLTLPSLVDGDEPVTATVVEDSGGLVGLAAALEAAAAAGEPVTFDCEWRPRGLFDDSPAFLGPDVHAPLALLQLATRRAAFVVDVLAFEHSQPIEARDALRRCVRRLFRSEESAKVGFALVEDLDRLEDAMPGVLEGMQNVTDLQRPATRALGLPRRTVVGLSKSCASLCGIALDKTQQRTDWQARPLSAKQVQYAALDAAVLHPLLNALVAQMEPEEVWAAGRVGGRAGGRRSSAPPSPPRTKRKAARQRASHSAPPPEPSLPAVSTRELALDGVQALLTAHLGKPIGGRDRVLRLCAGRSAAVDAALDQREITSAGGSGLSRWADDGSCLWINTANTRPHAGKYRNQWWREARGGLSGSVLLSWFPGRGQRLTDPSMKALLNPDAPTLLFCRRRPDKPYHFCGRLSAVAIASKERTEEPLPSAMAELVIDGDGSSPRLRADPRLPREYSDAQQELGSLQAWRTDADVAAHVIWRLEDADELLGGTGPSVAEALFGASGGVASARPAVYSSGV